MLRNTKRCSNVTKVLIGHNSREKAACIHQPHYFFKSAFLVWCKEIRLCGWLISSFQLPVTVCVTRCVFLRLRCSSLCSNLSDREKKNHLLVPVLHQSASGLRETKWQHPLAAIAIVARWNLLCGLLPVCQSATALKATSSHTSKAFTWSWSVLHHILESLLPTFLVKVTKCVTDRFFWNERHIFFFLLFVEVLRVWPSEEGSAQSARLKIMTLIGKMKKILLTVFVCDLTVWWSLILLQNAL